MENSTAKIRKKEILKFVEIFTNQHHYPPTIREIGTGIGVHSTSLILYYIDSLIDDGLVGRDEKVSRGIWVIK